MDAVAAAAIKPFNCLMIMIIFQSYWGWKRKNNHMKCIVHGDGKNYVHFWMNKRKIHLNEWTGEQRYELGQMRQFISRFGIERWLRAKYSRVHFHIFSTKMKQCPNPPLSFVMFVILVPFIKKDVTDHIMRWLLLHKITQSQRKKI